MIDLQNLPTEEAERIAYAEGFTGTAALFARISDLQRELGQTLAQLTETQRTLEHELDQTLAQLIETQETLERAQDENHSLTMRIESMSADLYEMQRARGN